MLITGLNDQGLKLGYYNWLIRTSWKKEKYKDQKNSGFYYGFTVDRYIYII